MKTSNLFLSVAVAIVFASCTDKEEVSPEPRHNQPVSANHQGSSSGQVVRSFNDGGIGETDPRPIRGIIYNPQGSGLENVNVSLHDISDQFLTDTYSDEYGDYEIDSVLPDSYKLHFNLNGYEELIRTIVVSGTDPYFELGIDTLVEE